MTVYAFWYDMHTYGRPYQPNVLLQQHSSPVAVLRERALAHRLGRTAAHPCVCTLSGHERHASMLMRMPKVPKCVHLLDLVARKMKGARLVTHHLDRLRRARD